jgi:hypothetical protein
MSGGTPLLLEGITMQTKQILAKDGTQMTTQKGEVMEEFRFEPGDEFIPLYNKVGEKTRDVEVVKDGKKKKQSITNYYIKCNVRDSDKNMVAQEVFVTLTPSQANTLKNKVNEGIELNQNVFVAYTYVSEKYGDQVGVGVKGNMKPAMTFDEFDQKQ